MASFTFVHAADIHLDSPLLGLERYEGAPVERLRGATREALENLVALSIEEEARFLLIAGDLYDGDWKDFNTGLFFSKQMARLARAGVEVYVVRGNHDAASAITRTLPLPDNVHEFGSKRADTVVLEDLEVAIHGRSYPERAVSEDLAAGYPDARPDLLNIGLLHTSADGRQGHEAYAPCHPDTLVARGYDYWALGHVHQREILHRDPWVVFPGNLQGRHARETGPKGCSVVRVEDGAIASVEHRCVDVVRWAACEVDLTGVDSAEGALDRIRHRLTDEVKAADDRLLAARIRLVGRTGAHAEFVHDPERWKAAIRLRADEDAPDEVWIEKVRFDTRAPVSIEALRERRDPLGGLLRSIDAIRDDVAALEEVAAVLEEVVRKLPPEVRDGPDGLDLSKPDTLLELLDEVEQLVVPELADAGGAS